MILNSLCSKGYTAEQDDETILIKPVTEEQPGTDKAKILVEARIIAASEKFLEDIGLEANSIPNPNTWKGPEPITVWTSDSFKTYNLILDDLQTAFLLKAAQAHKDTQTLTAPRVIVWDRKKAEIVVSTEFNYISGYIEPNRPSEEPVPKHDSAELGNFITVKPQLTLDDKKKIVIDLKSEIRELQGVEERKYKEKYPYQIPEIAVIKTSIQCLVPDGKTLLTVGPKIMQEVERVSRVPWLGDLPLIGMLFTNRSTIKEQRTLLIMVKPSTEIKAPPKPPPLDYNDPLINKLEEKSKRSDEG